MRNIECNGCDTHFEVDVYSDEIYSTIWSAYDSDGNICALVTITCPHCDNIQSEIVW